VLSAKENDSKLFAMILASRAYSGMVGFPGEEDEKPARRRKKLTSRSSKEKVQSVDSTDKQAVYVFKVKKMHAKRVWRQIEIRSDQTLDQLHQVIFDAFSLDFGHLYTFDLHPKTWEAVEYSHPQAGGKSAVKAKIGGLGLELKEKFVYTYDLGDCLEHEVELVEIREVEKGAKYPREVKRSKPRKIQCEDCEDGMVTMTCTDHVMHICESCSEKHEDCMTIELE
jgi:hypothetical protein